jgi:hypothetical protein
LVREENWPRGKRLEAQNRKVRIKDEEEFG